MDPVVRGKDQPTGLSDAPAQLLWETQERLEYSPKSLDEVGAENLIRDELDERGISLSMRYIRGGRQVVSPDGLKPGTRLFHPDSNSGATVVRVLDGEWRGYIEVEWDGIPGTTNAPYAEFETAADGTTSYAGRDPRPSISMLAEATADKFRAGYGIRSAWESACAAHRLPPGSPCPAHLQTILASRFPGLLNTGMRRQAGGQVMPTGADPNMRIVSGFDPTDGLGDAPTDPAEWEEVWTGPWAEWVAMNFSEDDGYEPDDPELIEIYNTVASGGVYIGGGGAAPTFLMKKAGSSRRHAGAEPEALGQYARGDMVHVDWTSSSLMVAEDLGDSVRVVNPFEPESPGVVVERSRITGKVGTATAGYIARTESGDRVSWSFFDNDGMEQSGIGTVVQSKENNVEIECDDPDLGTVTVPHENVSLFPGLGQFSSHQRRSSWPVDFIDRGDAGNDQRDFENRMKERDPDWKSVHEGGCPGCGGPGSPSAYGGGTLECNRCHGTFTSPGVTINSNLYHAIVGNGWAEDETAGQTKYFDLDITGEGRIHGWAIPGVGITQIGAVTKTTPASFAAGVWVDGETDGYDWEARIFGAPPDSEYGINGSRVIYLCVVKDKALGWNTSSENCVFVFDPDRSIAGQPGKGIHIDRAPSGLVDQIIREAEGAVPITASRRTAGGKYMLTEDFPGRDEIRGSLRVKYDDPNEPDYSWESTIEVYDGAFTLAHGSDAMDPEQIEAILREALQSGGRGLYQGGIEYEWTGETTGSATHRAGVNQPPDYPTEHPTTDPDESLDFEDPEKPAREDRRRAGVRVAAAGGRGIVRCASCGQAADACPKCGSPGRQVKAGREDRRCEACAELYRPNHLCELAASGEGPYSYPQHDGVLNVEWSDGSTDRIRVKDGEAVNDSDVSAEDNTRIFADMDMGKTSGTTPSGLKWEFRSAGKTGHRMAADFSRFGPGRLLTYDEAVSWAKQRKSQMYQNAPSGSSGPDLFIAEETMAGGADERFVVGTQDELSGEKIVARVNNDGSTDRLASRRVQAENFRIGDLVRVVEDRSVGKVINVLNEDGQVYYELGDPDGGWSWGLEYPENEIDYYFPETSEETESEGPGEGDITTEDQNTFYQDGRLILQVDGNDDWRPKLREYMDSQNFWPNVWQISDHGNAHLLTAGRRGRIAFQGPDGSYSDTPAWITDAGYWVGLQEGSDGRYGWYRDNGVGPMSGETFASVNEATAFAKRSGWSNTARMAGRNERKTAGSNRDQTYNDAQEEANRTGIPQVFVRDGDNEMWGFVPENEFGPGDGRRLQVVQPDRTPKIAGRSDRFMPGTGTYTCEMCGNLTREVDHDAAGLRLCAPCYEVVGWENSHEDFDHDHNPNPDCPICQKKGK